MTLYYENSGGDGLTLSPGKPYFLSRLNGTGDLRNIINTFHAPGQDGAFYLSGSLETRNITIEGTIIAESPDQAAALQKRLLRLFTPKARGKLVYRNAAIQCVIEEVVFSAGTGTRYPNFYISLLCPSPFFEAVMEIQVELAAWLGRFSFPLEIPEAGIELGERQLSQIMAVENNGDVPCGCTIVFTALGMLSNPEIMNLDTGEIMRIKKTLNAGEKVIISTHFAQKRVIGVINGEESNYYQYLDMASKFMQLTSGVNTLRYFAESNTDLLEVSVFYRPMFLGV